MTGKPISKEAILRAEMRYDAVVRMRERERHMEALDLLGYHDPDRKGPFAWLISVCKPDATNTELVHGDKAMVGTIEDLYCTGDRFVVQADLVPVQHSTADESYWVVDKMVTRAGGLGWAEPLHSRAVMQSLLRTCRAFLFCSDQGSDMVAVGNVIEAEAGAPHAAELVEESDVEVAREEAAAEEEEAVADVVRDVPRPGAPSTYVEYTVSVNGCGRFMLNT